MCRCRQVLHLFPPSLPFLPPPCRTDGPTAPHRRRTVLTCNRLTALKRMDRRLAAWFRDVAGTRTSRPFQAKVILRCDVHGASVPREQLHPLDVQLVPAGIASRGSTVRSMRTPLQTASVQLPVTSAGCSTTQVHDADTPAPRPCSPPPSPARSKRRQASPAHSSKS